MIDKRERGILALTIASILILAGIWCIYLSPEKNATKNPTFTGASSKYNRWEGAKVIQAGYYCFSGIIQPQENLTYVFEAKPTNYICIYIINNHIPDPSKPFPYIKEGITYYYYVSLSCDIYNSKNIKQEEIIGWEKGAVKCKMFEPPKEDFYKLVLHNPTPYNLTFNNLIVIIETLQPLIQS